MPEGSGEQKNLMGEPSEIGGLLAADKARTAGELRTADTDNYQPYQGEPEGNTETTDQAEEDRDTENEQFQDQQAQIAAQAQAEVAIAMFASKQRQARQIQMRRQKLEEQLGELEKDLTDFKHSKLGGFFNIFQPRLTLLIDILIEQMKKQANKMADEAKIGYYTGLIITVTSLIAILTAMKFLAAFLDAAFIVPYSCLRLVIMTLYTCIIPIILVLISPIYIPFLMILFLIGKIPLVKGLLTKNIIGLIERLKNQRAAWQEELTKLKKKVTLRKQIKGLKNMEKRVARKQ